MKYPEFRHTGGLVTLDEAEWLQRNVLGQILADETFQPTTMLLLSMGGYAVGAAMNEVLGVPSENVPGVPILKRDGHYYCDPRFPLGAYVKNEHVLVIDDSLNRGLLTQRIAEEVMFEGALSVRTAVLIANKDGILTDYVGAVCAGKPLDFYWKKAQRR